MGSPLTRRQRLPVGFCRPCRLCRPSDCSLLQFIAVFEAPWRPLFVAGCPVSVAKDQSPLTPRERPPLTTHIEDPPLADSPLTGEI
jgi:hypothetical protein